MSSLLDLSEYVRMIQAQLSLIPAQPQLAEKMQMAHFENNFYARASRSVFQTKMRIVQLLQNLLTNDSDTETGDKSMLKILREKLDVLNSDLIFQLKEGILILYLDIRELAKLGTRFLISHKVKMMVDEITESVMPLLRTYFTYQEYIVRKEEIMKENKNYSLSNLRKVEKRISQEIRELSRDQQLLSDIENEIKNTPIHLLVQRQTKKEGENLKQYLEICRICSQKIKMENIEDHVYMCQKKNTLMQQLDQKNNEIDDLLKLIKIKSEHALKKFQDNQDKKVNKSLQDFRKLAKLILCVENKKEKYVNRRCSLIGLKSEMNIKDKIESYIEDFIEEHGHEELLDQFLQLCKAKAAIEKIINNIERSCISNKENKSVVSKKPKCISIKNMDKMQKPENKSQIKWECLNIGSNSSASSEEEISFNNSIMKLHEFKSKDHLTKLAIENQKDAIKRYYSLQDISHAPKVELAISLKSFQFLQFLGQGAFGKVYLARRKDTKDFYAIKMIKICESYGEKELELIKNQHQIFRKIAGDHLVKAPFSFAEDQCHVFVLQYLPGGDLRKILEEQVYFQEERASFYLAEIVLAIEHLHTFGIIHRDLKPENLVIDKNGHLKLTDFGLSQFKIKEKIEKSRKNQQENKQKKSRKRRTAVFGNNKQKMKLIGTPDYIAPEIINQTSLSNESIDWWSLGIIAYELIVGTRPFCADTIEQVIDNITNFNIEWPDIGEEDGMISSEAKDLIIRLLDRNFMGRLGATSVQQIKSHPFFARIDWDSIKMSKPPVIPKLTNLKELNQLKENHELREEIKEFAEKGNKSKKIGLKRFVRFDLLGSETIESGERQQVKQKMKLKKLQSLQQQFLIDQKQEI